MRTNLLVMIVAAGLSVAVAGNASAQRMGTATRGSAGVHANVGINTPHRMTTVHSRAAMTARAQARGPHFTPHGWSEGRKIGWNCRVGTRGCIPPGLR